MAKLEKIILSHQLAQLQAWSGIFQEVLLQGKRSASFTQAGVLQKEIWIFPAGYTQMDLASKKTAGKTVIKYELWLIDQASNVISEVQTFIIDSNNYEYRRLFYFENSLSGIDSLICTGKREDKLVIERQLTERILDSYWSDALVTAGEIENYSNSFYFEYAISTGFQTSQAAIQAMTDLLISTQIREKRSGKFTPIILKKDSFKLWKDDEHQYFLEFEYRDGFEG